MTIILLTGAPGVGKTTALIRVARALKERGVKVGSSELLDKVVSNSIDLHLGTSLP